MLQMTLYYLLISDFHMYTGRLLLLIIHPGTVAILFLARNRTALPLYASLVKCHYFMCGPPLDSEKCLKLYKI